MSNLCRIALSVYFIAGPLLAHDPGLSSATLWAQSDQLKVRLAFAPADLEALAPLDLDADGQVSQSELEENRLILEHLVRQAIEVSIDGSAVKPVDLAIDSTEDSRGPNTEIQLRFAAAGISQLSFRNMLLPELPMGHRHYVALFDEEANLIGEMLLDRSSNVFQASMRRRQRAASSYSFGEFFVLGIEHILSGYDHLLFLLALLVVGVSFASAAKIITSFTIAHSITLALATFEIVRLAPAIVEPLIAASIAYVGLENLWRRSLERRWLLTFAFGLVHGLGFATALRELGVGGTAGGALQPLVAFNLGVEAGQIGVAAVALPILWGLKQRARLVSYVCPATSLAVVALGAWWLLERVA